NAAVQGESAPQSICCGITQAESAGCDVIIIGRGGGSSEDLSAFNTEAVARAVYNCKVPVISAVGHEVDFSITDMAADLRAPTPSAAAELAVPDIRRLAEITDNLVSRAGKAVENYISRKISAYTEISSRLSAQSPENRLKLMEERLGGLMNRAETAINRRINDKESDLREAAGRLDSLSPLKVMARGYSLVYSDEKLVRDSDEISEGQRVMIRFNGGGAEAEIKKIW
ncbi:MAG: exodeoxyribonuclease VII large subunit, partial [Ruminococcus sp.]|nr:exodeoxyribonuclease VII large subunit [Ruminococcus sp.]